MLYGGVGKIQPGFERLRRILETVADECIAYGEALIGSAWVGNDDNVGANTSGLTAGANSPARKNWDIQRLVGISRNAGSKPSRT